MTDPDKLAKTSEFGYFLKQIPGLWAGRSVPVYPFGEQPPGSLDGASEDELRLIVNVATRQLADSEQQLEQIRQRSQFLFTALLALVGFAALTLRAVIHEPSIVGFTAWVVAFGLLLLALLGATCVIVNQKVMGELDAGWLSRQPKPWLDALANDALTSVQHSHTTVANQLTYFRDSALLTIGGVLTLAVAWVLAVT